MTKRDIVKKLDIDLTEMFQYLDVLRKSGVTNMWGAGSYLEGAFNLSNKEAGAVLFVWMETFSEDETPNERATKYLKE